MSCWFLLSEADSSVSKSGMSVVSISSLSSDSSSDSLSDSFSTWNPSMCGKTPFSNALIIFSLIESSFLRTLKHLLFVLFFLDFLDYNCYLTCLLIFLNLLDYILLFVAQAQDKKFLKWITWIAQWFSTSSRKTCCF